MNLNSSMYEALKVLDPIRLNFEPQGMVLLNLVLAFVMFGVALNIKPSHITDVVHRPKSVLIGLLSQFIVLPVATLLLTIIFSKWLTPGVALGMILVASCPGGNISNFVSSLAKGNIALSVSLTGISSIGALLLTPLNFSLYGTLYLSFIEHKSALAQPISIDPEQMFQTVFIILGIPLILGYFTAKYFPKFTKIVNTPIKILSILVFAGFVAVAFRNNYYYFARYIHYILAIVLVHNTVALLSGYSFASLFKLNQQNRRTIAIETGIQNSGLGLALIFNPKIFSVDLEIGGMAFIVAWWGIWHIISGLGLAFWWSKNPIE